MFLVYQVLAKNTSCECLPPTTATISRLSFTQHTLRGPSSYIGVICFVIQKSALGGVTFHHELRLYPRNRLIGRKTLGWIENIVCFGRFFRAFEMYTSNSTLLLFTKHETTLLLLWSYFRPGGGIAPLSKQPKV